MYVCLCYGITDTQIKQQVSEGAGNVRDIKRTLGAGEQCGRCIATMQKLIDDIIIDDSLFKEVS